MSNLLPEKAQKQIRSEYRARFILTGSSLAIGAAVFCMLALSPSFSALYITRPAALEQASQVQQTKEDGADIAHANMLLIQLAPIANASSSISDALVSALTERKNGVHINSIAYMSGAQSRIMIIGEGDSRADIDKYHNALKADPHFSSAELPIRDLLSTEGGPFTITLTPRF